MAEDWLIILIVSTHCANVNKRDWKGTIKGSGVK